MYIPMCSLRLLIPATCLALVASVAGDPPNRPAWWSEGDAPVITGGEENNQGPANIGQAKWMAKRALDLSLIHI